MAKFMAALGFLMIGLVGVGCSSAGSGTPKPLSSACVSLKADLDRYVEEYRAARTNPRTDETVVVNGLSFPVPPPEMQYPAKTLAEKQQAFNAACG